MARDLGQPQALEPGVLREAPHAGVGEGVAGGEDSAGGDQPLPLRLEPARADASDVAALAGDEAGDGDDRHVRHRPVHLGVEGGEAQGDAPPRHERSRLASPEPLRLEVGVREGERVAHAERAVELVQGGAAEGSVARGEERDRRRGPEDEPEARAEGGLLPVGERRGRGDGGRERGRDDAPVAVGPRVEAQGPREEEPRVGLHEVLEKDGAARLRAPRLDRRGRRPARVRGLFRRALDDARLGPGQEPVARPEESLPLGGEPEGRRGHALRPREVLTRAVGGDGAEGLVEDLRLRPQAGLPPAALGRAPVDTERPQAGPGVVHLQGRAVLAVLPEGHRAQEGAPVAERPPLDRGVERRVARGGLGVRFPPAPRRDRHVAARPKGLGRDP